MIYISHRGNIDGVNIELENSPNYVTNTLELGYDVEIDLWYIDDLLMSGHDYPKYELDPNIFFKKWKDRLWIHCKNIECINFLYENHSDLNYFWHQTDTITLTSRGYIWAFVGKQPIKNSIAVMPEINNDDTSQCVGICSDLIKDWKNKII